MTWDEAMRRIGAGEDVEAVLDEKSAVERDEFVTWLRSGSGDEAADRHLAIMKEIDSGRSGARGCWSALSHTQRRALEEANNHGGWLKRVGKQYRHRSRNQPYVPIYAPTVRNLCARDLMEWDGGAFDPEAAASVTERGRFVLKHGAST